MRKKLFSLALGLVLVTSLCACSKTTETKEEAVNQEYIQTVRDAATKLKTTYKDYVVTTGIEAPDGNIEYIEVQHGDCNYTEYSVDADNNYGTIPYGSEDKISYSLSDWITEDGQYYMFAADNEGKDVIYTLPENYTDYVSDRTYLYVNTILDGAKSIEKYKDMNVNLGNGDEKYSCYKIKVSSDTVKKILGAGSYDVYKSIKDSQEEGSSISTLMDYYLEDLDMNLTFSDAIVVVGIDNNDILKYMYLEVGGLGTRLYLSKAVVATSNSNVRTTPDFTGAVAYETTLKEYADYIASFDSYEDAVEALNSNSDSILPDLENPSSDDIKEETTEASEESTENKEVETETTEEGSGADDSSKETESTETN